MCQEAPMTLPPLQPECLPVTSRLRSQWRPTMLEDLSQGAGANHEKEMDATAQVSEEDSNPEEPVVSQAKKQRVSWMGNGLGRTLPLVLRPAVPF